MIDIQFVESVVIYMLSSCSNLKKNNKKLTYWQYVSRQINNNMLYPKQHCTIGSSVINWLVAKLIIVVLCTFIICNSKKRIH